MPIGLFARLCLHFLVLNIIFTGSELFINLYATLPFRCVYIVCLLSKGNHRYPSSPRGYLPLNHFVPYEIMLMPTNGLCGYYYSLGLSENMRKTCEKPEVYNT